MGTYKIYQTSTLAGVKINMSEHILRLADRSEKFSNCEAANVVWVGGDDFFPHVMGCHPPLGTTYILKYASNSTRVNVPPSPITGLPLPAP